MDGAKLVGANLENAELVGAKLRGARLMAARLVNVGLVGADLEDSILVEADLTGGNLRGASLKRSNLQKASFKDAVLDNADFEGAIFSDPVLVHYDCGGEGECTLVSPSEARIVFSARGIIIERAILNGTDLRTAKNLTQEQIDATTGDETTLLRERLTRPSHWSKSEQPSTTPPPSQSPPPEPPSGTPAQTAR